jgi:Zn-dependent peptidase ImmA (M78 family)
MLKDLLNGDITQEEYLNRNNISLREYSLPKYIYGFIYKHNNIKLVAINKNLSRKKKQFTILHEFAHYELGHLDKVYYCLEDIEDEADNYIKEVLNEKKEK